MILTDVGDELEVARVGTDANEQLEFLDGGREPQPSNNETKHDGASRINGPVDAATQDTGGKTSAVDDDIVAVIFPEDAHLAVLVA